MVGVKPLLDARDLQAEYSLNRRQAYALLDQIGVRITPRRLVVLRSRLEEHLGGGDVITHNGTGDGSRPPTDAASRA
jgi:hypothetical protein